MYSTISYSKLLLEYSKTYLFYFRYAFKLTYDEAVLGRIDDDEELLENLNDYKQNWFIGTEDKSDWNDAIAQESPYLFSIGYDEKNVRFTVP